MTGMSNVSKSSDNTLYFENLSVSSWDSNSPADTGFEDYQYKATISGLTGVTADTYVTAILDVDNPEDYACVSGTDSVTIYAKSNTALDISLIIAGSPVIADGSDLPEVTASDNGKLLGVVNGVWSKVEAPSGEIIYSTSEQKIGKWIDNSDLYEKTIATTISSGRALATALSTLLGCTPDYVGLSQVNAKDYIGQIVTPYSTDGKLIAPSGLDYGSYCSGLVSYPHITLPAFNALPSGSTTGTAKLIFFNSLDNKFYAITGAPTQFYTNDGKLYLKYDWQPTRVFTFADGDSEWYQAAIIQYNYQDLLICNLSSVNKFKIVYVVSDTSYPYTDGEYSTTLGKDSAINVRYFDPATGAYLNNDQSALGNRAYAGQDYLFVYVNENNELCIANGSNYPVLPMTVYTTIQYTKSNGGA